MNKENTSFEVGLFILVVLIGLLIGINFLAVWLWNFIAVGIFGLPILNFWQMFCLRFLIILLFPSRGDSSNNG